MSQNGPERTKKKSTKFVEIIHSLHFHKHVDHIFEKLCQNYVIVSTQTLTAGFSVSKNR